MTVATQVPVNFRVVESYDKGGIRGPDAAMKYGPRMLTLGEAYPFFGDDRLWERHKGVLQPARPVHVRTRAAISRPPLGETIVKDGKDSFLVGVSDGVTERHQLENRFLTNEFLSQSGLIFIVENGSTTRKDGPDEFTHLVGEGNDMRVDKLPDNGLTETTNHPLLFGTSIKKLKVFLSFPNKDVAVGLVGAGGGDFRFVVCGDHRDVLVPDWSSDRLGVLVNEASPGGAAAEKTAPAPADQKIFPVTIDLSGLKALEADAKAALGEIVEKAGDVFSGQVNRIQSYFDALTKE